MALSREELEQDLAEALSRHIGYTAGAYRLDRMVSVTTTFGDQPSIYQLALMQHLVHQSNQESRPLHDDYAEQILNFTGALRLIYKAAEGPTPGANRFALTSNGVLIKSAMSHQEFDLVRFALLGLTLQSDCDAYGLLLDLLDNSSLSGATLQEAFLDRFSFNRNARLHWLSEAFPNKILLERIYHKLPWMKSVSSAGSKWNRLWESAPLSKDFARHHVTPRLGWAKWFGHVHTDWQTAADGPALTTSGLDILRAIRGPSDRYEWLGPHADTLQQLKIATEARKGPWAPSWNLLRPITFRSDDMAIDAIVEKVVHFMDTHYDSLKLVYANQVSILCLIPYIHWQEHLHGYSVDKDLLLERIFSSTPHFTILSTRNDRYGYFQRRMR